MSVEKGQDEDIMQMLENDEIKGYKIVSLVQKLSDAKKKEILYSQEFISKHHLETYDVEDIIKSMEENAKIELLFDKNLIENQLHLKDSYLARIVKAISQEDVRAKILEMYKFQSYSRSELIQTLSYEHKVWYLLHDNELSNYDMQEILKTISTDQLIDFMNEQGNFLKQKRNCTI